MLDLCIFNYFYVLFEEVISHQGNYSNFAVITFFYTCENRTYIL